MCAYRQIETALHRVQIDEVAQDVTLDRCEKRVARRFEALKQICAAKTHQSTTSTSEVFEQAIFRCSGLLVVPFVDKVAEAIARQAQVVDETDDFIRIELGVVVGRISAVDGEGDGACFSVGEIGAGASAHLDVTSAVLVKQCIAVKNEASCATHHVVSKQIAPVFFDRAVLERLQGVGATLLLAFEKAFAAAKVAFDQPARAAR